MRLRRTLLALTCFWSIALGADSTANLSWQAPTQNCDGSTLQPVELSSFVIGYGSTSRNTVPTISHGLCGMGHGRIEVGAPQADGWFSYDFQIVVDDPTLRTWIVRPQDPGMYYMAITARTNNDADESRWSGEVYKEITADPSVPWIVEAPTQEGATMSPSVELLVGETGKPVTFAWQGGTAELQLVQYGRDVPILTGTTSSGTWGFTPTRAGLYEVRLREPGGEWTRSSDLGYAFYFKLASPDPGGID